MRKRVIKMVIIGSSLVPSARKEAADLGICSSALLCWKETMLFNLRNSSFCFWALELGFEVGIKKANAWETWAEMFCWHPVQCVKADTFFFTHHSCKSASAERKSN
ncbi:hypothetical protein Pelo_12331 [Pelomyxa schiedti]|nr:hypothetical protein Pelo_12331 [Pelomyxa schiedti]